MAQQFTLARPYARAVFKQAQATQQLDQWDQALMELAGVVGDADIKSLLHNPVIPQQQIADLLLSTLVEIDRELCAALAEPLHNFVQLLVQRQRADLLPEICALYQKKLAESRSTVNVEVISAKQLTEAMQKKFQQALSRRFDSEVNLEFDIDNSIIGGAIIRSGNWVMDGSIQGKLSRLNYFLEE